MALKFIDFKDVGDIVKPNKEGRSLSFSISDRRPDRLCLHGGLSHATFITFDHDNAQKLIEFLKQF